MNSKILKAASVFYNSVKIAQQDSAADRRVKAEGAIFKSIGVRSSTGRDNFDILNKSVQNWFGDQFEDANTPKSGTWGLLLKASPNQVSIMATINGQEGSRSRKHFGALSQKATASVKGIVFEPFEMWLSPEQSY